MNANKATSILLSTLQCIAAGIISGTLVTVLLCLIVLLLSGNTRAAENVPEMQSVYPHHSHASVPTRYCSTPARITIKKGSCAFNDCPPPLRLVAGSTMCLFPHQGKSCTTPPDDGLGWNTRRNKEVKLFRWADTRPISRLAVPRLETSRIVLAGAGGASLASGPGLLSGAWPPWTPGYTVVAGYRDT